MSIYYLVYELTIIRKWDAKADKAQGSIFIESSSIDTVKKGNEFYSDMQDYIRDNSGTDPKAIAKVFILSINKVS
jgi:hypothetical protein